MHLLTQQKLSEETMAVKEQEKAPNFKVKDDQGNLVELKNLKGKKIVLYFYPKDMTPGCTQESCDFRDSFSRIKKKGALIFGISKDDEKSHKKFKEKYELPFPLLSDVDGKMCEAYGVWKEKSMYGKKYMGIERSTFIIDESGKVSKIFSKVKVSGHVDEVLSFL
jgi:peroxiredoxin Q/BCP